MLCDLPSLLPPWCMYPLASTLPAESYPPLAGTDAMSDAYTTVELR
jgi:hypothetical protein